MNGAITAEMDANDLKRDIIQLMPNLLTQKIEKVIFTFISIYRIPSPSI